MLKLKIKEDVMRDIIILTIPSRESHIINILKCLEGLDPRLYRIVLVCNVPKDKTAEAFVEKIFYHHNPGKFSFQVVYNSDRTLPTGRNKGVKRSIANIKDKTRITYIIDDDIIIYHPQALFDYLEQGLQYAAFIGYPTFEILPSLPLKTRVAESRILVDSILKRQDIASSVKFLDLEKPRRYTPFRGETYENGFLLFGHVHGNLQLHFTRVLEEHFKDEDGLFNKTREWYGEYTELNYHLQRYGLMGGYLLRSPNKKEHRFNAERWGLIFHNEVISIDSPTRSMSQRNENMLRSYIYLTIESGLIPLNGDKEEFMEKFLELLNTDFRFMHSSQQEFAKLLQVRYSTQDYLFGTKNMSVEEFEISRKMLILKIIDEVYKDKDLKEALLRRKIEYETAPFKLVPFEQLRKKSFNDLLRYQNEALKPHRQEIFEN